MSALNSVPVCENHPDRRATVQCVDCEELLCDECKAVCYDLYNQPLCINCAKIRCKRERFASRGKIITVAITLVAFIYGFIQGLHDGLSTQGALINGAVIFVIIGGLLGGGLKYYSRTHRSTTIIWGNSQAGIIFLVFSLIIWLLKILWAMIVGVFYVYVGLPRAIRIMKNSKAIMAYLNQCNDPSVISVR